MNILFTALFKLFPPRWNLIVLLKALSCPMDGITQTKQNKCYKNRTVHFYHNRKIHSLLFYYFSKYLCVIELPFFTLEFIPMMQMQMCDVYWHNNFENEKSSYFLLHPNHFTKPNFLFLFWIYIHWWQSTISSGNWKCF